MSKTNRQDIIAANTDGTAIARAGDAAVANYSPIVARTAVTVRVGTSADLPFIDRMQKAHSKALGFLPTKALEGKVALGQVLVGEKRVDGGQWIVGREDEDQTSQLLPTNHYPLPTSSAPIAYLIAADRYQKRDEIGYVTQLCVAPEYRRSLVAGQLLQAQFDRSAYGCKLYCCWCAQDLTAANAFWESMGFTAIAFRMGARKGKKRVDSGQLSVGSEDGGNSPSQLPTNHYPLPTSASSSRIHIFWQKRIRAGDETTPWWYPSQTGGGALREDRLVFPILPGVHWRDVGPVELNADRGSKVEDRADGDSLSVRSSILDSRSSISPMKRKPKTEQPRPVLRPPRMDGGMWFEEEGIVVEPEKPAKAERPKKVKQTIDPRLKTMARELRDQWSERADAIVAANTGKHDVKRIVQGNGIDALRLDRPVEPKQIEQAA